MTEQEFDKKVMNGLIELYKDLDKEINSLEENVVMEHCPGLISRREKLEDYITNYAQHYFPGLAYAERMEISEIEEYTSKTK